LLIFTLFCHLAEVSGTGASPASGADDPDRLATAR
jgi:hypothetical protein